LTRPARLLLLLSLLSLLPARGLAAMDGFLLYEGTLASVNREVLFLSDVRREQCLRRCAAMPGSPREDLSLEEARDRRIADILALQEQGKLLLGQVDNAVLEEQSREAAARMAACASPCREDVSPARVSEWVERRLLIRDFLRRRVSAFVEIKDEEVQKEYRRRLALGEAAEGLSEERIREELLEAEIAREVRNWYSRAASKSTITLSPLEGK